MVSLMPGKSLLARAALFLLFLLLVLIQLGERLAEPELRAEDGPVFYRAAHELGAASWNLEHNGYHHLACRLVALASSRFDCRLEPRIYMGAALVAFVLVALLAARRHAGLGLGFAAAFILVLMPQDGTVIGHLTDLPSLAALLLVVLVLKRPESRPFAQLLAGLAFVLAAFTGPYVAFFLPLVVVTALRRRNARDLGFLGAAVVASYFQLRHLPFARSTGAAVLEPLPHLEAIGARMLGSLWPSYQGGAWAALPALGAASLALLLALLVWAFRRRAWTSFGLLCASLLALTATLLAYRGEPAILLENPRDRYSFVSLALLLWGAFGLIADREGESGRHLRFAFFLILALSAYGNLVERPAFIVVGGWDRSCELAESGLPFVMPVEPSWPVRIEPRERSRTWQEETFQRAFGAPGVQLLGLGEAYLSQVRGESALAFMTEAVLVLPPELVGSGDRLAFSALAHAGSASGKDLLRYVVEEVDAEGRRREIAERVIEPARDHDRPEAWSFEIERIDPEAQLILRCEAAKKGAWLQLWSRGSP